MLVSAVQESGSVTHIHTSPPSWTSIPPPRVSTEHRAKLPVPYSSFPLAIYWTRGGVGASDLASRCSLLLAQCPHAPLYVSVSPLVSPSVVSNSLQPHGLQPSRLLCPWNSLGKSTGAGCHFPLLLPLK